MRRLPRLLGLAALWTAPAARGATELGHARQEVVRSLSVQKMTDLDFGRAEAPSEALTIDPATSGPGRARFLVRGQPQTLYHVKLPSEVVLRPVAGDTAAATGLMVRSFRAFPNDGDTILDGGGRQVLSIGATRAAIPSTQEPGKYEGVFTITVCYNC